VGLTAAEVLALAGTNGEMVGVRLPLPRLLAAIATLLVV